MRSTLGQIFFLNVHSFQSLQRQKENAAAARVECKATCAVCFLFRTSRTGPEDLLLDDAVAYGLTPLWNSPTLKKVTTFVNPKTSALR
jgi:hypothetical protein